jgi:hypothetical protein
MKSKNKNKEMASLFTMPIEVILEPLEGRYYYVTEYNERIGDVYFTTHGLKYVGKYFGTRMEGWGKNMKEMSHFMNDEGQEIIITHTEKTAFYPVKHLPKGSAPAPAPAVWPNESKRQAYYDAQIKEVLVVRTPVEGKYYEATFWDKKEGHWSVEKHYAKETTPREYVGQYLRHEKQGYGDGADHWAIFLKDGKEIKIEYDYDGKRAWYEEDAK